MKTFSLLFLRRWLTALWVFVSGGVTLTASSEPVAGSALPPAVNNYRAAYAEGIKAGRPEAVARYYAENVRLMPEFQKTVIGLTNAVAYGRAFADRFEVKSYQREVLDVLDLGTRLAETGHFSLEFMRRTTGETRQLGGKYLEIWDSTQLTEPKLVTVAWNYDRQIDFSDELRFPEIPAVTAAFLPRAVFKERGVSFDLEAYNRLLEKSIIQHDGPLWALFYADDAVLLANYSPAHVGRMAIDAYLREHVRELPIFEKLDIRNDRVETAGKFVIEYASHVASWRNGNSSGVSTGKNIRIWRRDADGSLRILRQIAMYD